MHFCTDTMYKRTAMHNAPRGKSQLELKIIAGNLSERLRRALWKGVEKWEGGGEEGWRGGCKKRVWTIAKSEKVKTEWLKHETVINLEGCFETRNITGPTRRRKVR